MLIKISGRKISGRNTTQHAYDKLHCARKQHAPPYRPFSPSPSKTQACLVMWPWVLQHRRCWGVQRWCWKLAGEFVWRLDRVVLMPW